MAIDNTNQQPQQIQGTSSSGNLGQQLGIGSANTNQQAIGNPFSMQSQQPNPAMSGMTLGQMMQQAMGATPTSPQQQSDPFHTGSVISTPLNMPQQQQPQSPQYPSIPSLSPQMQRPMMQTQQSQQPSPMPPQLPQFQRMSAGLGAGYPMMRYDRMPFGFK